MNTQKTKTKRTLSGIIATSLPSLYQVARNLKAKEIIDIRDENDKSRVPVKLTTANDLSEENVLDFLEDNDLGRSSIDFYGIENFAKTQTGYTFILVFWYNP